MLSLFQRASEPHYRLPMPARLAFVPFCVLLVLLAIPACNSQSKKPPRSRAAQRQVDYLNEAMTIVLSNDRFNYADVNTDIANGLNAWAKQVDAQVTWQPTPLIQTLPARIQETSYVKDLPELKFVAGDGQYLHEAAWLKSIVNWVIARQPPGNFRYLIEAAKREMDEEQLNVFVRSKSQLTGALRQLHPELTLNASQSESSSTGRISDLDKLARAVQLFDWTVRNIQLERLPKEPAVADIEEMRIVSSNTEVPSLAGLAGPGYQRMPWHLLAHGLGDAWERGRLFISLLHEARVPAVMLGVRDVNQQERIVPWLVGVLINNDLYLFDPRLGLPIPGPGLKGIATLTQVQANPSLLSDLDLTPAESRRDIDYPVVKGQLSHVVALIDASCPSISKRMALVQTHLAGERRLNLTLDVDGLDKALKECPGVAEVRLWDVPFLAEEFRKAVDTALQSNSSRLALLPEIRREQVLGMKVALIKKDETDFELAGLSEARHRFLCGIFADDQDRNLKGAAKLFDGLRLTDQEIDGFDTNARWKAVYGLTEQGDLSLPEYQQAIMGIKGQLRLIRVDATYWLALTHFENENISNAANWLETQQGEQRSGQAEWQRWKYGGEYLRGRCYEGLRDFDQAIDVYNAEDSRQEIVSAQFHGNILRGRLLKKWAVQETPAGLPPTDE